MDMLSKFPCRIPRVAPPAFGFMNSNPSLPLYITCTCCALENYLFYAEYASRDAISLRLDISIQQILEDRIGEHVLWSPSPICIVDADPRVPYLGEG